MTRRVPTTPTNQPLLIASVVARYWARHMMTWDGPRGPGTTEIQSRIAAHPLGCTRAALAGESDPRQLGVEEGRDARLIRRIAKRYSA